MSNVIPVKNLWRRCSVWIQNKCNSYEQCGKYPRCREALDRMGHALVNSHCTLALNGSCKKEFNNCGKIKECAEALKLIKEKEDVYFSKEYLELLGIKC